MPALSWIGKEAVVGHHTEVPLRLLEPLADLSVPQDGTGQSGAVITEANRYAGNLILQGDNLHALKALLPRYAGQVKCVYIDPPYNTGQDDRDDSGKRTGWVYSDNVDSPEIRDWLNKVVGVEAEDLCRHDKWLCMMYPRLRLLKEFLREDGIVFVSIDDIEIASLRMLLDEIFGIDNRVGTIVWKNATDNNPTQIATEHEYVVCYAKDKRKLAKEWKATSLAVKSKLMEIGDGFLREFPDQSQRQAKYTQWFRENKSQLWPFEDYKFIDDGGIYTGMRSVHNPGKEGYRYDVIHPVTHKPCQPPMMGYRFPEETMKRLLSEGRIIFGVDETKLIELKVYVRDYRAKLSSLFELDGRIGTNEIKDIFPESKRPFDFPKPIELIEELLSFTTTGDDLVLDSFAGSGTTGHAVLSLNRADGQRRRFVLIEMKQSIAREITAERVRRVSRGYKNASGVDIAGLGGGFQYCTLSEEPMFTSDGRIREGVKFSELAEYIWFIETGGGRVRHERPDYRSPLVGVVNGTAIFLLFNGILKDRSDLGGNVLNSRTLDFLREVAEKFNGAWTVYGARTRFDRGRLNDLGITFKQLPYELTVAS